MCGIVAAAARREVSEILLEGLRRQRELRTEIAGRTVQNESLVNAPNWLPLTFAAADGPWLDLGQMEVLEHWQELRDPLQLGELTAKGAISPSQDGGLGLDHGPGA